MRDPLTWSIPIGRVFGITVRLHVLFLMFAVVLIARGMGANVALEAAILAGILFLSVLLHEFGHCFAARFVDGDAEEIMLWPLGGLAYVNVPNTASANFVMTAGGPAVNVLLCILAGGALAVYGFLPPIDPTWYPYPLKLVQHGQLEVIQPTLTALAEGNTPGPVPIFLARLFSINWILFWFNILLVGFPLDGGRMLQCILWPRLGYAKATRVVIFTGYLVFFFLVVVALIMMSNDAAFSSLLLFSLGLFIYSACRQQAFMLETGGLGDEGLMGYDFSQGYTSLEKEAVPRRRRVGFWKRWLQRRVARKRHQEEVQRMAEERRLDELLAKVQNQGTLALTDEERRFLTRVSAKYRDRNRS